MAKIWKPLDIGTYLDWAEIIIDEASDNLTDWEISFVDSIHGKLLTGQQLTEAQANRLEKIYAEKTK
jgi:hypothetical protein